MKIFLYIHPARFTRRNPFARRRTRRVYAARMRYAGPRIFNPRHQPTERDADDARRGRRDAHEHKETKRNETNLFRSTTYLNLGRLEGGDAADERGSEERGHCSLRVVCWNDADAVARGTIAFVPNVRSYPVSIEMRDRETRL